MFHSVWRRFTKRARPASRQVRRRPRCSRLQCEEMEPRLQPSVFGFATDFPDGRIATISEPPNNHNSHVEFETADDFTLSQHTVIYHAAFSGLLTGGASLADVSNVFLTIYRVFPNDSDVSRTSGPPVFSTNRVPTRVNSPADNEILNFDSAAGELDFHPTVISQSFTAQNSVTTADKISVHSGGNGPATGELVNFDVDLRVPLDLAAGHYFFVPKVGLKDEAPAGADFLWLSSAKPIQPPGTPFTPDLQSWMRDDPGLAPDWLRIGTDIIGGTTFNGNFALIGFTVDSGSTGAGARSAANGANLPNQDALLFNSLGLTNGLDDAGAPQRIPVPGATHGPSNAQTLAAADTLFAAASQNTLPNGPPAASHAHQSDGVFIDLSDGTNSPFVPFAQL